MVRRIGRGALWLVVALAMLLGGLRLAAALRETGSVAALAPAAGRMIATDRGDVFVLETGPEDGAPVLLIHGSVGWSGFWGDTPATLAQAGYRAIAMDLPPMGFSERDPTGDYRRTTQGARILSLIRALGVRPILAAHSFGAGAAAEAVLADPAAFAGFVIVDGAVGLGAAGATTPLPLRNQAMRELAVAATVTNPWVTGPLLRRFIHRKDAATDARLATINHPLRRQGTTEAIARWLPTLVTTPASPSTDADSYGTLRLPVAIIWGAEDTVTPPAQGRALQAAIPGATLAMLPDVGHIPHIEDPAAFDRALIAALGPMTAQ